MPVVEARPLRRLGAAFTLWYGRLPAWAWSRGLRTRWPALDAPGQLAPLVMRRSLLWCWVLLASGAAVPISQLRVGDNVLATNTKAGKTRAEAVTAVLVHRDTDLCPPALAQITGQ